MNPALDLPGFIRRTVMPPTDVAIVETSAPGFTGGQLAIATSKLYSRLGKRYSTPFGTTAPSLGAVGTAPPPVTLSGVPSVGSMVTVLAIAVAGALGAATFTWSSDGGQTWTINPALASSGTSPPAVTLAGLSPVQFPPNIILQVTTAGAIGVAVFRWSKDGGVTWTSAVTTAASVALAGTALTARFSAGTYATDNVYVAQGIVTAAAIVLGSTGMTANFPAANYAADNVYQAPAAVPEIVLGWLSAIVTPDLYRKRGVNPADPQLALVEASRKEAWEEVKEAADSKDGLFDLPTNDAAGSSAVSSGGPGGYTEASPYVWTDVQESSACQEDINGTGTSS